MPEYQLRLAILYHGQARNFAALKQFDQARSQFASAAKVLESVDLDYDLIDARAELGQLDFNWAYLAGTAAALDKNNPPLPDRPQRLDRLAGEAIEQLRRSWGVGYLQNRTRFKNLIGDQDLDPFRGRDDFKKRLAELQTNLPPAKP